MLTGVTELDGRPAVSVAGERLVYGELREAAAAVSAKLDGASRVAVWAQPSLEFCVAAVAALGAGVALVPINPKLGRAELRHVLSDSHPDILIGAPKDILPALEWKPRGLEVDLAERRAQLPATAIGDEDPALIVYTSGTTGRPKAAVLSRRAITSNLDAIAEAWGWSGADVLVHGLPLFHVHGLVLGLFGPLRRGGALRHLGGFDPTAAAAALRDGGTMLFGVPTMYHRLGREAEAQSSGEIGAGLRAARLLVSGSAALPAPEFERIRRVSGQEIVERYGLTETMMNLAVRADGVRRPGRVGTPIPGVDVRLVDDDGNALEACDGETMGEVVVRGPNLFSEYLNRPDATAAAMREGWFHTGDLATRDPDGYWRIVGRRATDLIKTGGFKVGAGEVEVALLDHPRVLEAAVTGEPDPDLGERIIAWVVADGSRDRLEEELTTHVAGELAPHKRPREVRFLQELPRNALGKVIKQQLRS
ncbi:MAG TPA: AMP-binding protein [Solirubrobacteraceae bacterium]|jgi:malonyl-CoA/methylmalonyl-CoA synthetase|nr:AMP-binding protein [Solirubrobacteraceae bacterium]